MSKTPTTADRVRMGRGDYRPGDLVNGHRLTADGRWVADSPQKATRTTLWILGTIAVVSALLIGAAVLSAAGSEPTSNDTFTIAELATLVSDTCYDNTPSSNGVTLPGTREWSSCTLGESIDVIARMKLHGQEIVTAVGTPVAYDKEALPLILRQLDSMSAAR